jgi:hypothetical protein
MVRLRSTQTIHAQNGIGNTGTYDDDDYEPYHEQQWCLDDLDFLFQSK